MLTLNELFLKALAYQKAGQLQEAEALCLQLLQQHPGHPNILVLLAGIVKDLGKPEIGLNYLRQAVSTNPANPNLYNTLGNALKTQGNLEEAQICYQKAVSLKPDYPQAWFNLGNVHYTRNEMADAVGCYRQAQTLAPDYTDVYVNLGSALHILGRRTEAIACYQKVITLKPNLCEAHYNLGNVFQDMERFDEAMVHYEHAVRIRPQHVRALYSLGNALLATERYAEAIARYQEALRLAPNYHEAYVNLGTALYNEGRFDEAEACCKTLLQLKPDFVEGHNNLGITLQALGQYKEAQACYEEALRLKPTHAEAHWNWSLVGLMHGDYLRGWEEFEWRFQVLKEFKKRTLDKPQWDGAPFEGKRLLVIAEQGFGDIIQCVRYLPQVKTLGGEIVLECPPELMGLVRGLPGVDDLVDRDVQRLPMVPYDAYIHLMSLPSLFNTTLETIPPISPSMLAVDPAKISAWRQRLSGDSGLKIGIAWAGNPKNPSSRYRSCPLEQFTGLSQMPGVTLYSLQKGEAGLQAMAPPEGVTLVNLAPEIKDFEDTAAIISNLDMVITVDTVVAHLAGALLKPVWVLLPYVADWRWLLNRTDSPWYPTMRLFRQTHPGDWPTVFDTVLEALKTQHAVPQNHSNTPVLP